MIRLSPAMTWSRHGTDIYVHGEDQVSATAGLPARSGISDASAGDRVRAGSD